MDARRGPGRLTKLQGRGQILGNRLAIFPGLGLQADQVSLELSKLLLPFSDILSQCGQILFHGFGNIVQIMTLTELMGNPRQGFGNRWRQSGFLVGNDPKDGQTEGSQLPDERHQLNLPANDGFLPKQRNSRQSVDDQVDDRLASPVVNGINDGQKEPTGGKLLKHGVVGSLNVACHKGLILSALILDTHLADRQAPFLEDRMDPWEPEMLMKTQMANLEDDIETEPVMGKGDQGLLRVPIAEMRLRAAWEMGTSCRA